MKWFVDGDQVVVTKDDFVNLQESPAVFIPLASEVGSIITEGNGSLLVLPLGDLFSIREILNYGGGIYRGREDF